MTTNAIEIVRDLRSAGMEPKIAEAVAEAVVKHSDESHATKSDIARLEGKLTGEIKSLAAQVRMLIVLVAGIYVGFAVFVINNLSG